MINMNTSWCVLHRSYMLVAYAMLYMTTLLILNKSYPINLVMFGGTNHADYYIRDITGMDLRLPEDEPSSVDLCKGSCQVGKYNKNANENNRNQRLNYTYQTHLVEDILSSNNPRKDIKGNWNASLTFSWQDFQRVAQPTSFTRWECIQK